MIGLTSGSKERIGKIVEEIFDRMALQLIGQIPRLRDKKLLIISSKPNYGLPNLFVQAMANKVPNLIEQDVLKGLLESAFGYIEALKNRTRSNVAEAVDGLVREAKTKDSKVDEKDIQSLIEEELRKSGGHLKAIAESETNKIKNIGVMMDISRMAASVGDGDPTVAFLTVHDDKCCHECKKLHLLEDETTPRVYKFSELSHGYHKRGENSPSIAGLHPNCRCQLIYLTRGFGFKNGFISYISEKHDEWKKQKG